MAKNQISTTKRNRNLFGPIVFRDGKDAPPIIWYNSCTRGIHFCIISFWISPTREIYPLAGVYYHDWKVEISISNRSEITEPFVQNVPVVQLIWWTHVGSGFGCGHAIFCSFTHFWFYLVARVFWSFQQVDCFQLWYFSFIDSNWVIQKWPPLVHLISTRFPNVKRFSTKQNKTRKWIKKPFNWLANQFHEAIQIIWWKITWFSSSSFKLFKSIR